jgi:hypothetical protein
VVDLRERRYKSYELVAKALIFVNVNFAFCSSEVNLSGVNGNVIMSGWEDDNPDNARREATRDNTTGVAP